MTDVLTARGKFGRRHTDRGKGHVKMQTQKADNLVKSEAEVGVSLPQDKECLGLPEAGRGEGRSFPRGLRGSTALHMP